MTIDRHKAMGRVDLMLNQKCNTRCIFCYLYGVPESDCDFSLERMKATLDEGARRGYRELYLSGGEPTLNDDLAGVIAYAKGLGYDVIKIMTNGLRFSYPKYARKLASLGLNEIAFSLHGADADTHDKHTGYKGSFDMMMKAIDNALALEEVKVEVNSVITRFNIDKMDDIIEFAVSKGIRHVHLQLVVPNSRGNRKLFPDIDDIKRFFAAATAYHDRIEDLDFAFVPFCYLEGKEDFIVKFDFTQEFFSNARELFDAWTKSLLDCKKVSKICDGCSHFDHCRGHWDA